MQWLVIGVSGVTCGGKTTLAHNLRDYFQRLRGLPLWDTAFVVNDVQVISQDDYFLPVDDLRHKWNDKLNAINFELITSLDMKQMMSDITWWMKGRYLVADPPDPLESLEYINQMSMNTNFEHYAPTPALPPHYRTNLNPHNFVQHTRHQIGPLSTQPPGQQRHHSNHVLRMESTNKLNVLILEGFMLFNQPEVISLCHLKFHFHLPYERCYERRQKRSYDPPDVVGYFEICVWPHYEKNFAEFRDRKDLIILNGETNKDRILQYALRRIGGYLEEHCDFSCPQPPLKILGLPSGNCQNGANLPRVCPMEQQ